MSVAERVASPVAAAAAFPVTGGRSPVWLPSGLFALAQPGGWWDFSSNDGLFQDAAGTTPVTALGQPVGLALDKRLWQGKSFAQVMTEQAELVSNGGFDTNLNGWVSTDAGSGAVSAWSANNGGSMELPRIDGSNFARREQAFATISGRTYRIVVNVSSQTVRIGIGTSSGTGGQIATQNCAPGETGRVFVATSATTYINFIAVTNGTTGFVDNVSVREIPGNHAYQETSASRPIWQADTNGFPGLQFDGVDDFLVTQNIDFSATDKMLVAAAVRKLSDANHYTVVDLPSGTFHALGFPRSISVVRPYIASGGVERRGDIAEGAVSAVIAGLFDNAGAADADKLRLRYNGANAGTISGSGAAISFSNTTLEIGRRRNASNYFNGFIHQLVVRGGALPSAAEIAQLEAFIAGKNGVAL